MSRCNKCGIEILDNACECPLCHSVPDGNDGGLRSADMYPDVSVSVRKFRFIERLVLLVSVVAMMGLVLANIIGRPFVAWTVIIGLILIYINTVLRMTVTGRVGYQSKTLWLTFTAVVILIGIDALTGYRGWSLDFVLPAAVLFLDLAVFILMLVNLRNWQSYIPMQILQIVLSVVMLVLSIAGVISYPVLVYIALAVSVLLFAGTVIMGGGRAARELYRRFHI